MTLISLIGQLKTLFIRVIIPPIDLLWAQFTLLLLFWLHRITLDTTDFNRPNWHWELFWLVWAHNQPKFFYELFWHYRLIDWLIDQSIDLSRDSSIKSISHVLDIKIPKHHRECMECWKRCPTHSTSLRKRAIIYKFSLEKLLLQTPPRVTTSVAWICSLVLGSFRKTSVDRSRKALLVSAIAHKLTRSTFLERSIDAFLNYPSTKSILMLQK